MQSIVLRFRCEADLEKFSKKVNIAVTKNSKSIDLTSSSVVNKKEIARRVKEAPPELWRSEWFNMPEYSSENIRPFAEIRLSFDDNQREFVANLLEQKITPITKSAWYPKFVSGSYTQIRVVGGDNPKYPIYIVSKGRAHCCYTSRFLSQMEVPHVVVVEPSDVSLYKQKVENSFASIIELDMSYKDNYDVCDDLGDSFPRGSGGARNFCWDHSTALGAKRHWLMDDNTVTGFYYFNNNIRQKVRTGAIFSACETFSDRYENLAISGLQYRFFCPSNSKRPAYTLNTRVYSYLLIRNDIPYRWRGRYNEDTDLSLRVLKDGWCTVLFNAFLAAKSETLGVRGGNTDSIYVNGTYNKSKMIADLHPDVAKVVWKYGRWHHHVDYRNFTQTLKLKEGFSREFGVNNHGMVVIQTDEVENSDTRSYLEYKYRHLIGSEKNC